MQTPTVSLLCYSPTHGTLSEFFLAQSEPLEEADHASNYTCSKGTKYVLL